MLPMQVMLQDCTWQPAIPWYVLEVHVFEAQQGHLCLARKDNQASLAGLLQHQSVQHSHTVTLLLWGSGAGRGYGSRLSVD
mgnify:CR=1